VPINAREFFTRFVTAVNARDQASLAPMFHPAFTSWSPQSGERSRGFDAFWTQMVSYPGGAPQVPQLPDARILGDEERWAITPSYTVVPLAAANEFTALSAVVYPGGFRWHVVSIIELRDDLIYRMEFYYAPELAAPLADSIATYAPG
jgi:hypothetical protein